MKDNVPISFTGFAVQVFVTTFIRT